jgi:hypothetical protein
MHAKPQLTQILITKKLRHWYLVATRPFVDRSCPTWRARKNYQRLCNKYPKSVSKLGLNQFSAYE